MTDAKEELPPVASLPAVLGALHDPVRLEMVRRLSNAGAAVRCGALYEVINKSTATHHFKILREAGVIERVVIDGQTCQRLRTADLDAALPGVLAPIVDAANRARLDTADPARLDATNRARLDATDPARLDATNRTRLDTADQARLDTADRTGIDATNRAGIDAGDPAGRLDAPRSAAAAAP